MKPNPVVHFEMPAKDSKRISDFYAKAFGWQTKQLGPDMGNYILATTTDSDEKGVPRKPGTINGGFFVKTEQNQVPGVVIQVEDIKEAMKKVETAGGKVLGGQKSKDPDDMPGIGLFVNVRDPEGNKVTLMQPARN
jgi:uncharacterized protein